MAGGGAMMSANPSMMMGANAPAMAMNETPAGKGSAEPPLRSSHLAAAR